MEENSSKRNCASLPLSALRLLVPPVRLVSAAVWHTVQQKHVADYGMLEEFVSMVTDIVPELFATRQRAQLVLGLRARMILELCRFEADSELVQPHLDRVQHLIQEWVREAGAENRKVPNSEFVDLVKNLLKNPEEREHFFQKVFPEEFGPRFEDTLDTLMWTFLSRLEEFLPLQSFHQVSSMFGEVSSVLEDCMNSVSGCEELKTLLLYQKDLSRLDHNDGSLDGACIISALKLHSVDIMDARAQADVWEKPLSCTSDLERESLASLHGAPIKTDTNPEDQTSDAEVCEANWTLREEETALPGGEITPEESLLQRQEEDVCFNMKECHVQLKRLDLPLSAPSRPVRANRGLRMKKILLEEKRDLRGKITPDPKPAPRKRKTRNRTLSEACDEEDSNMSYISPISNCSEDDSWSYYSDNDSFHKTPSPSVADSWSNYSDDGSVFEPPVRTFTDEESLSSCSNEETPLVGAENVSNVKASATKKKVECFICKELINTRLRTHMKTHFPTGDYACPRCDSRFKLLMSLKQHLKRTCFEYGQREVDPEKPDQSKNLYKCDKCEEAFRYKVSLQKHNLTHHELYCSVCRKVLRDAAALARHKASHTLFQCTRCEETFTLYKPLLKHCQNIHKINKPFRCNRCSKTFSKLRVLIAHEWKHTGHLPFQCAQCSLRVKTDADLVSHQRVHTREKPYLCAECGKTFAQRSNLLRHLNLIHSESRNEKKYSCSECEKSFKEKASLKKHQRSKHFETLTQLFRHPCQYCGKMVAASTIARHKLIHTGERPFKCTVPECENYFRSTSEVKRHVLIHHTTERPYKCDDCGKGFVKKCYLNSHAKIHSGEKPFVCHCCGKAFLKLYSMHRHKRLVHTVETK
ncbi:zinc finger and SCAN domain-containing protein 12-like [Labrus mixtus]|uniref:zinc finger and SCAN domain-containing protein 12-like n=1 Tax=Labrus mixtus TaxID=508554 RepID=UPI0029BFEFE9|nr:zinc finger and SCAN domain-containing protein 12-like [Labrus mixtus]